MMLRTIRLIIITGGVPHHDDTKAGLWVEAHDVEESSTAAEVLDESRQARARGSEPKPTEPDVHLVATDGEFLHDSC